MRKQGTGIKLLGRRVVECVLVRACVRRLSREPLREGFCTSGGSSFCFSFRERGVKRQTPHVRHVKGVSGSLSQAPNGSVMAKGQAPSAERERLGLLQNGTLPIRMVQDP